MIRTLRGRRRRSLLVVVPTAAADLAAVDDERLGGDETRVLAREEQHGHRLIPRRPGVLQRDPREVAAYDVELARIVLQLPRRLRRDRLSGRHAVRADAEVPDLVGERVRQRHQRGLGRVVDGFRRFVLERVRARDVDDRSGCAAIDQVAAHVAHEQHRRADVHRKAFVDVGRANVDEGSVRLDAGVVDQHVDATQQATAAGTIPCT